MKLRQKLAVVLASAMVVTAVPVVTMAASDNGMLREVLKVEKDTEFVKRATAGGIEIKLKDAWQGKEEVFYLTLENAEWNDTTRLAMVKALGTGSETEAKKNVEYDIYAKNIYKNYDSDYSNPVVGKILFSADKEAKIKIFDDAAYSITDENGDSVAFKKLDQTLRVPLLVKAKEGDAKVKLEKSGSTSTITDGEWTFATTAEKKLKFTAADPEVVYETGKLAAVTFEENFSGAFTNSEKAFIEYELQDADYEFDFTGGTIVYGIDGKDTDTKYKEYVLTSTKYVETSYGFAGQNLTVNAYVDQDDKGRCVFEIVAPATKSDSIGKIKLKDIPVRNDEKDIVEGDLLVDIQNFGRGTTDLLDNGTNDVKLGKIVAYSTTIEMKDQKPVDIVAGRVEEIEFTLKENIDDSMVGDREIEISLVDDLAHFDYDKGDILYSYNYGDSSKSSDDTYSYDVGGRKGTCDSKGYDKILDDQSEYKLNDGEPKIKLVQSIKVDPDNNSKLIVKLNPKAQINGEKDKLKIKIKVCVPVAYKDKETITLKATGRGIEENKEGISTTAINIKNPFDVTMEEMRVKVGLQNQVGGKVTITETDKEMFSKGNIYLKVVDPATGKTVDGITFYTDKESDTYVTYETKGDIKKADLDTVVENGAATIKIKRQSKSASTLNLSDFHVTVDRTVPEGKYDLVLTGDAISEHYYRTTNSNSKDASATHETVQVPVYAYNFVGAGNGDYDANANYVGAGNGAYTRYISTYTTKTVSKVEYANDSKYPYASDKQAQAHEIVVPNFFVVGTPNTEDITANGLRRGTATFVIGESKYVSNGFEYTMDAASYIQDPGYTMIPVRYVAEAFGVEQKDILFSNGTATIFAGERTIQLTNNSDIAMVNGAAVKMGTKVVIKDGRTYAPVGEVARILGIKTNWDAATKTASFINE